VNVHALADLTAAELRGWQALYAAAGSRVQQSPDYAAALQHSGEDVAVAIAGDAVAVLTVAEGRATMACADIPVLSPGPANPSIVADVLTRAHQVTGLPVYMPLADPSYAMLAPLGSFRMWERSPNSVIDWSRDGDGLLGRVRERGGSQAVRKRQMIERDGLALDTGRHGEDAARDMLAVDDRSWKAAAGQGMRQRGHQAGLYSRLISQGTATVTFLRHRGEPVAFRIDARADDRLACLKWSYDQAYARYSPGAYLLTVGLLAEWTGRGITVIDLFGGPDHLKNLVYSHRVPRIDAWYGDDKAGAALEEERLAFDARLRATLQAGKGLRHAFT
jgi:hypothetical protein